MLELREAEALGAVGRSEQAMSDMTVIPSAAAMPVVMKDRATDGNSHPTSGHLHSMSESFNH
jgi:hypothetical protein